MSISLATVSEKVAYKKRTRRQSGSIHLFSKENMQLFIQALLIVVVGLTLDDVFFLSRQLKWRDKINIFYDTRVSMCVRVEGIAYFIRLLVQVSMKPLSIRQVPVGLISACRGFC